MSFSVREKRTRSLTILDITFEVEVVEIPFREGVELRTVYGQELIRVSDRQLGEEDAMRLLAEELEKRVLKERGIA